MFNSNRYITKGVQENISLEFQFFMWDCIDKLSEPKDYLQVFNLSVIDSFQRITHTSEEPEYKKEYLTAAYAIDAELLSGIQILTVMSIQTFVSIAMIIIIPAVSHANP